MTRRLLSLMLSLVLVLGMVGAFNTAAAEQLPLVELKIMVPGDRPADMDKVLAEIESRAADTLNVKINLIFIPWSDLGDKTRLTLETGEDVDLIFDAPWLHMDQMISQGLYEPMDDLIAEYGPHLLATRPEQMWEANKWDGKIMGLPLGDTFGGTRSYYVRKDVREALGIEPLKTHADLVSFLYAVKEQMPEMIPYSMDKGALDNNWSSWYLEQLDPDANGVNHSPGGVGMSFLFYTEGKDGTQVKNICDDPNEEILGIWKEARQLYLDGIINPDILASNQLGEEQFKSGKVACIVNNAAQVQPSILADLKNVVPEGEIEVFSEWDYTPKKHTSDFKLYNFLCVAKVSQNKERAVQFLDWAVSSQDNYDLFAYGIEGVNFEAVGDKQYTPLQGYAQFQYVWVMNPMQDRLDARYTPEDMEILLFFRSGDNFEKSKLSGFSFTSDAVASEMAIFSDVESKYMPAVGHGVIDPDETLASIKAEAYDAMIKIQAELQKQLDAHIAAQ